MQYLQQIRESYYFRKRIPTYLVIYFKRTEIKKSLDTKNLKIAKTKATIIYNKYQEIIKVIKLGALTEEQIHQIVDNYVLTVLNGDKHNRANSPIIMSGTRVLDMEVDKMTELTMNVKDALRGNNYDAVFKSGLGADILKDLGITPNPSEPSHRLFAQTLMRGMIEITEEIANRARGEYSPKYDRKTPSKHQVQILPQPTRGKSYQEAYDEFKIYYSDQRISKPTKEDTFRVLDRLMVMIGKDTIVSTTKMTDLIKIKQQIENLPSSNFKEYNKLSFEEIVKLKNIPIEHRITDSRAKDYLKHIKKFFSFCHQNQIIPFDPSVNLTITVASDKKDHFSDDEVKQLFALFDTQKPHIRVLLYAYPYSGMRREELFNSTIEAENGIQYFKIAKGKNSHSIRKIPLHSKLIELGLDNEILSTAKTQTSYAKLGNFFNAIIKPQVTTSKTKTLHSFRHTVATKLQAVNVPDSIIQNIIGHSAKDTLNKTYARDTNLPAMKEAIEKLDFYS